LLETEEEKRRFEAGKKRRTDRLRSVEKIRKDEKTKLPRPKKRF